MTDGPVPWPVRCHRPQTNCFYPGDGPLWKAFRCWCFNKYFSEITSRLVELGGEGQWPWATQSHDSTLSYGSTQRHGSGALVTNTRAKSAAWMHLGHWPRGHVTAAVPPGTIRCMTARARGWMSA